jgi:hypothetical protein
VPTISYVQRPLSTLLVERDLNDTLSTNKTERAVYYLNNAYSVPVQTYLHEPYTRYLVARDLKEDDSPKDQSSTNKTERAYYYLDGTYSIPMTTYLDSIGTTFVVRDLNDTVPMPLDDESKNKTERAIYLTSYPYSYGNYLRSYYLLKRDVEGEIKMSMKDELSKNDTVKRALYYLTNYGYPMTTSLLHEPYTRYLVARDLKDEESMALNKTEKRAIFYESPRVLYTSHYSSPLAYIISKRGSDEVKSPIKNEQGVKDESGSSMETSTEFNRRAIKPDGESEEETSSIRPRGMNPSIDQFGKMPGVLVDGQRNNMLNNDRSNEESQINDRVPGQKQPINKAEKSHN